MRWCLPIHSAWESQDFMPDLISTTMPDLDGYQVLRMIRSIICWSRRPLSCSLPSLSGRPNQRTERGADDYMGKPLIHANWFYELTPFWNERRSEAKNQKWLMMGNLLLDEEDHSNHRERSRTLPWPSLNCCTTFLSARAGYRRDNSTGRWSSMDGRYAWMHIRRLRRAEQSTSRSKRSAGLSFAWANA